MKLAGVLFSVSVLFSASWCWGQSKIAAPMEDVNKVIDNTLDSLNKARTVRPVAGSTRVGSNPVLFLVGNSTMRTGTLGNGQNGQWGWGYFMPEYFDSNKITVENHALGGMSSRTFYNKLWSDVVKGIRPGDWVIIELGHNDNGPYDSGRARASIPGIGNDSLVVIIKETGEKETVYTYGEYMRRYINDVRNKGGNPILFSLTPRCAWDDKDSTVVTRVNHTFGLWARLVAEAEGVPFVDLNEITARKFERFGKEKVKTMFYLDRIHSSEFGARVNAESAVEGLKELNDIPLGCWMIPMPEDKVTGASRRPGRPVVFTIGDSTVKNEDKDDDSMWGWGSVIAELFDTTRVSVENHAKAGRSARTFLDEGCWGKIYDALRPGDFVLMQFGHNDGGDINTGKARGELHGSGSDSKVFKMEATGKNQVVYTYGWYLRKYVMDAREKGAIPVIISHTTRNKWTDGKIESNCNSYGRWAREAARQTGAYFIDLNAITGRKLQALGEGNTSSYFKRDHTHTSLAGARLNARGVAEGLMENGCPLKDYLKPVKYELVSNGNMGTLCGDSTIVARNYEKGDYGFLYCHMSGRGEWTAYALSRDGLNYHDIINGDSIFSPSEKALIEGGTRDAYITRKHDGSGYLMVTTDMCVARSKKWHNYGINLLTSDDLVNWNAVTFDFRKGPGIFSDQDSKDPYTDYSSIVRVWAPQILWNPDYTWPNGHKGGYMIYYSLWNPEAGEEYDRMYYSYADESFTTLTKPRLLFDWGYATIDADINYLESDGLYHMMIKKEGGKPGLFTSTAPALHGPWSLPVDDDYVDFEGNKKCEGVSAFRIPGEKGWRVGYIEYSSNPKRYRICQTDEYLRNFHSPIDIKGVDAPQHGSFMRITKEEYDRIESLGR